LLLTVRPQLLTRCAAAQVLAGQCLRVLAASLSGSHDAFVTQVQWISCVMAAMCVGILALHHYITTAHAERVAVPKRMRRRRDVPAAPPAAPSNGAHAAERADGATGTISGESAAVEPVTAAQSPLLPPVSGLGAGALVESAVQSTVAADDAAAAAEARLHSSDGASASKSGKGGKQGHASMSFVQAIRCVVLRWQVIAPTSPSLLARTTPHQPSFPNPEPPRRYCWDTPTIRCLATMAVAQGLCSNLAEFAWKHQLRILHPTPQAFSGYMGNVASCTGVVTVVRPRAC